MLKKILYPLSIGVVTAVILLFLFPSLRNQQFLSQRSNVLTNHSLVSFNYAVQRAAPAVVNIYNQSITKVTNESPDQINVNTLGSGVIMNNQGYILTNRHVVNNAQRIIVTLQNGQVYQAVLVGSDKLTDLAVLKIDPRGQLPVIPIDNTVAPKVGDIVLAIGNPYNIGQTITQGIISATGRIGLSPYGRQNFIQTDASINRGNSGGALVNTLGELVGINTLSFGKVLDGEAPEGIGFAIPTPLAVSIMNELIKNGKIVRGYIGIDGVEYPPISPKNTTPKILTKGILVTNVSGPAEKAGIKPKDILIAIDNKPVKSIIATMEQISETPPDTIIPVELLRDNKKMTIDVKVAELKVPNK